MIDLWDGFDAQNGNPWFSTPFLIVADTIRVLIILASMLFLFLCTRAIFSAASRVQRALLTSNACYAVLGLAVTYARLGDPVTLRFILALIGVSFGLGAMWFYNFGTDRFPSMNSGRAANLTRWVRRPHMPTTTPTTPSTSDAPPLQRDGTAPNPTTATGEPSMPLSSPPNLVKPPDDVEPDPSDPYGHRG